MSKESGLWNWLKGASCELREYLHMDRVENIVMKGMPDVEGHLLGASQFWIELKSSERPAKDNTPIRFKVKDREAQIEWLEKRWTIGGNAWLLLQVGSGAKRRLYLVEGGDAEEVYAGVTEATLQRMNWLQDHKPTPADVVRRASQPAYK